MIFAVSDCERVFNQLQFSLFFIVTKRLKIIA